MTKLDDSQTTTPKKPYTPPQTVVLGHVRDLTLGGGSSVGEPMSVLKAPKKM